MGLSDETFTCGSPSPRFTPGPDTWIRCPNGDRVCSFCGSLHPEDFERLAKEAADKDSSTFIDPTTKQYKWYVRRDEVPNASAGGIKFYSWHAPTDEVRNRINAVLPEAVRVSLVKIDIRAQDALEEMARRDGRLPEGGNDGTD
ncbi:hypothetical protein [Roseovarius indicus]|uniref:Uncharacterized protein n=1 Tax=Roseovarius indicus TaxID=540747 RepID=A0A0T5P952_9RHOB|nr:hypothetical protein [Roseovarius indicus]KRS17544.1 hypothetical protein XM52_13800 [Roseovarius indicus]QEW26751.1 hypothetical protein RIdsm_02553 [Roseovarius indicus]SFD60650.1 hypothetical protein SAMN04488031_101790 [Roseovarius indicus]